MFVPYTTAMLHAGARYQVCCPRVGNPTNLQVRWYAAMPTSFGRIKKSEYAKQMSALDPSNTKGFPVGTYDIRRNERRFTPRSR